MEPGWSQLTSAQPKMEPEWGKAMRFSFSVPYFGMICNEHLIFCWTQKTDYWFLDCKSYLTIEVPIKILATQIHRTPNCSIGIRESAKRKGVERKIKSMVEYSKRSSTGNPFPLFLAKQARKETFP